MNIDELRSRPSPELKAKPIQQTLQEFRGYAMPDKVGGGMPGLELRVLTGMAARHYKLIISVLVLAILSCLAVLSQLEYRYTADALLVIDESESQLVGLNEAVSPGVSLNSRVDTDVEILKSSSVALGVIDVLKLWNDDEFGINRASLLDRLKAVVGIRTEDRAAPVVARVADFGGSEQAQLVDNLNRAVKISRRGLTSIIAVSATSRSPEKAAKIANGVAEAYLDVQIETRVKTAQRAANFLQFRVEFLAKSIQETDQRIDDVIIAESERVGTPEARAQLKRMGDDIHRMDSARASMAAELAQLQQLQGTDPSLTSISVLRLSGDLQVLAEQRAALAREAQSSTKTDVRAQLEAIDAQIKAAAQQRDTALREQLTASDTQTAELRKSMLELFSRQPIPSDVAVDLYRLRQESDNQRKLYESYSQRLGEVQQKINLAIPNSRIVSPAIVPHDPSFPPSRLLLALASILGIGLGGGAAMVREHLVGGFASPEQVEAVTGLPVVASIPNYRGDDPHDAIISHPFSAFAESIRRLRAGIENILGPGRSKIILVTSTEPNEGKSTLAVSLARALATSGYKTLLIDGDLRHPSIRKMTSAPSPAELLELILNVPKGAEITKATGQELPSGLYTIDAAPTKQYASDVLVGTSQFEELLGVVRSFFEYVVIDSPPIGYIVDAKIMSRLADACLYVVKHNATSQRDTLAGLREMREMAHAPPTAIVLNNVQEFLGSYYFRKGKYGSYYEASGE